MKHAQKGYYIQTTPFRVTFVLKDMNGDGKIDGLDRIRPEKNQEPRFVAGLTPDSQVERLRFESFFPRDFG